MVSVSASRSGSLGESVGSSSRPEGLYVPSDVDEDMSDAQRTGSSNFSLNMLC